MYNEMGKSILVCEYLTCFSILCDCAKVASLSISQDKYDMILKDEEKKSFIMSLKLLTPFVRISTSFLSMKSVYCQSCHSFDFDYELDQLRVMTGRLRMLKSYIAAISSINKLEIETGYDTEFKKNCSSNVLFLPFLNAMRSTIEKGVLDYVLPIILQKVYIVDWIDIDDAFSLEREALVCGFVHSFFSLVWYLIDSERTFIRKVIRELDDRTSFLLFLYDVYYTTIKFLQESSLIGNQSQPNNFTRNLSTIPRMLWFNHAQFAVCMFVTTMSTILSDVESIPYIQSFAFAIIGRLNIGEEAMAALILSQDILFLTQAHGKALSLSSSVALQSMMLDELCNTEKKFAQLDHSFKLFGESGIIFTGMGPFSLKNLRNKADFSLQVKSSSFNDGADVINEQLFLPLGRHWLWEVLSSTVFDPIYKDMNTREVILRKSSDVIISCLRILLSLENASSFYTEQVDTGTKIYYLLNSTLFPEYILREKEFSTLFLKLFEIYSHNMIKVGIVSTVKSFINACYKHYEDNSSGIKLESTKNHPNFTLNKDRNQAAVLRTLANFVEDICYAFLNYGAQYECVVHSVRFFFLPGFPIKVKINVINNLCDVLHLLSTENEIKDKEGLVILQGLERNLNSDFSNKDGFIKDSTDFLDTLATILKGNISTNSFHRLCKSNTGGFFYLLAVGHFSRNLVCCLYSGQFKNAMKKWMTGMNDKFLCHVGSVSLIVKRNEFKTTLDLCKAVVNVCIKNKFLNHALCKWVDVGYDENTWETMIHMLKNCSKNSEI